MRMSYATKVEIIEHITFNGGATIEDYHIAEYDHGYNVATTDVVCETMEEVLDLIEQWDGNCGVWCSDGLFYCDRTMWVESLEEAKKIGNEYNQQSIWDWENNDCIYL